MNFNLNEKIGIDQIAISNIKIQSIDFSAFATGWPRRRSKKSYYRPLEVSSYSSLEDIIIVGEDTFSRFEFHANHFSGDYIKQTTKLLFSVNVYKNLGNINNGSAKELKERLAEISYTLFYKFGIKIDYSKATISLIEINSNIVLDTDYFNYDTFFYYLMTETKYFGTKMLTYDHSKREVFPNPQNEGFVKTQKSKDIKIYNKTKETLDKHHFQINKDILRVEIKLKNSDSISKHLKESRVMRLTDDHIYSAYNKLVLSQFISFLKDKYPKIEKNLSKQIVDYAQNNYYQSVQHIANAINNFSNKKVACILTTSGIISEFRKRNPYKKNIPKYIERLNKVLSETNYDFLIHMQKHVDFFIAKLELLQNRQPSSITLSYIASR